MNVIMFVACTNLYTNILTLTKAFSRMFQQISLHTYIGYSKIRMYWAYINAHMYVYTYV